MKKIAAKVMLIVAVLMIVFRGTCLASAAAFNGDNIASASVMLIDAETGTALYEKNPDAKCAPASTTKLLTAVIALENLSLNEEVTVPAEAQTSGTNMGLKPGNVVTVETLLYGMLMCSGNDAAVTLAIKVSGSVEAFAKKMNEKAQALGMTGSHFVTASGLDNEDHYVTVRDMARLAKYAYTFEEIRKIADTPTYSCTTVDKTITFPLESTNRLIFTPASQTDTATGETVSYTSYEYEYATGLKTGSTSSAKNCLVASAEKDGHKLIALIYGDPSSNGTERWTLAKDLFEYGFANYTDVALADLASEQLAIDVSGGPVANGEPMKLACTPVAEDGSKYITLSNDVNIADIQYKVYPNENVAAPVEQGQAVGRVELYLGEEKIFAGSLVATDGMMTKDEYSKLTGNALRTVDPLEINGNIRSVISKYIWLWLLIPASAIAFFVVRTLRADKRKMSKYLRSAQARHGRRVHVGVRYSQIRKPARYARSTGRRRYR